MTLNPKLLGFNKVIYMIDDTERYKPKRILGFFRYKLQILKKWTVRLLQISDLSLVNFARQTLVKLFRSDFAKKISRNCEEKSKLQF